MSIILSLIVFSVLVLIHEFGHFLLAKKNGIGVTEFSLGMGPRIVSFTRKETKYSWKLIPFGGSCMMVGEDDDDNSSNSFNSKSVWARISVIAAGPIFNFILAFVLSVVIIGMEGYDECSVLYVADGSGAEAAGLREGDIIKEYNGKNIVISRDLWLYQYMHSTTAKDINITYERDGKEYKIQVPTTEKYNMGISYYDNTEPCEATDVVEGSAADQAGIKTGDIITSIAGTKVASGSELKELLDKNPLTGEAVEVVVIRDKETLTFHMTPTKAYSTGFNYSMYRVDASPLQTLRYSFTELRYDMESTLKSFYMLFTGQVSTDDVSGPVGIVSIVGDAYEESKSDGARYIFLNIAYLIVLFSVNLGVLNLFPLPALDGGRLVFLFIEAVRGKPVPREKEAIVHLVGMVILMILMVLILFNDIGKLL